MAHTSLHPLYSILADKSFHPVIVFDSTKDIVQLDLTSSNALLSKSNITDTQQFNHLIFNQLLKGSIGVGGYGEHRMIYQRSAHYEGTEARSVHLGIDLWVPAHTAVFCPLDGKVHSFRDNQGFGDYGPTIIMQHEVEHYTFYTLYGHLSRASLQNLSTAQTFKAGDKLGEVGNFPENGDWPPHLHFQIITSMEGYEGDFPGVARPSEAHKYLYICPDPNLILQLTL